MNYCYQCFGLSTRAIPSSDHLFREKTCTPSWYPPFLPHQLFSTSQNFPLNSTSAKVHWDSCLLRVFVFRDLSLKEASYLLAPSGALIAILTYYWSTHPTPPPHFFRSHRSSTLDFYFLSHYSYVKATKLDKGNHWTQLLAECIPYRYNRISLQDSAR